MTKLADKIEALGERGSNELDGQVEIELFRPNSCFTAIRANNAGTKVIYTDRAGNEVTAWAYDWTVKRERQETINRLRAREAKP